MVDFEQVGNNRFEFFKDPACAIVPFRNRYTQNAILYGV